MQIFITDIGNTTLNLPQEKIKTFSIDNGVITSWGGKFSLGRGALFYYKQQQRNSSKNRDGLTAIKPLVV